MKRDLKRVAMVVGILAMLIILAAIALSFISCPGWGCQDSKETPLSVETYLVQDAMFAMMADKGLTALDGHTSGQAVNEWTGFPTGTGAAALDTYIKKNTTVYYYCWDNNGNVYPRSDDLDDAEKPGECPQQP